MAYYCLCDCDDYSYTILLLDYLIKMGNLVGLVYFIVQSDFFTNLFKSDEKKWTKIVKNNENDNYSIITSDDEEYQDKQDTQDKENEQETQETQETQDKQEEEDEKQKTD